MQYHSELQGLKFIIFAFYHVKNSNWGKGDKAPHFSSWLSSQHCRNLCLNSYADVTKRCFIKELLIIKWRIRNSLRITVHFVVKQKHFETGISK